MLNYPLSAGCRNRSLSYNKNIVICADIMRLPQKAILYG